MPISILRASSGFWSHLACHLNQPVPEACVLWELRANDQQGVQKLGQNLVRFWEHTAINPARKRLKTHSRNNITG